MAFLISEKLIVPFFMPPHIFDLFYNVNFGRLRRSTRVRFRQFSAPTHPGHVTCCRRKERFSAHVWAR